MIQTRTAHRDSLPRRKIHLERLTNNQPGIEPKGIHFEQPCQRALELPMQTVVPHQSDVGVAIRLRTSLL